jgi:hypothetical protein
MTISKLTCCALSLTIALHLFPASDAAAADVPAVKLEFSAVPEAQSQAEGTRALFLEWYPRINEILFGSGHPLPYDELTVDFAQELRYKNVPAYAEGNVIHVWYPYTKSMPDSYSGMMIHELTHINQHYTTLPPDTVWLCEGIADYVRHKYFEKDIAALLHTDHRGVLLGYSDKEPYFHSLQTQKVDLTKAGYLKSYTVASTFLYWLEQRKNPDVVKDLNLAMNEGSYSSEQFQQCCGASLDDLWREFMEESAKSAPGAEAKL